MSNNEIFDIILVNLSNKLIDKYLRKIVVIKYKNTNKYQYNINSNKIISNLENNLNKITDSISKNLNIADNYSLYIILNNQVHSEKFKKNLDDIEKPFYNKDYMSKSELKLILQKKINDCLIFNNLKEKVLTISKESNFKSWLQNRWRIIFFGYLILILFLILSYYTFVFK